MVVKLVVAVTDNQWFEHLRSKPNLPEVNFWSPSGTAFRALQPGELFLFKLHAPKNYIVGGGVFAYANNLSCSLAWKTFGEANGARTLDEMRARIARYRKVSTAQYADFDIGCRILTQPFFLEEYEWLPVPPSFASNIVTFKTYSSNDTEGKYLWDVLSEKINNVASWSGMSEPPAPRFGAPSLVKPRLGQSGFRLLVTDVYRRRCAITNEKTLPALDAAHIRPYAEGGEHAASNGILMRRDIHSLFDSGYVTITPNLRFEVSRRIREEFENGRDYYALHGKEISSPDKPDYKPDKESLSWHNSERFLG